MIKRLLTLLLFVAISLGLGTLYLSTSWSGGRSATIEKRPVFWLSDEELVLLSDTEILARNLETGNAEDVIFAMPEKFRETDTFDRRGCFSDTLWRLWWSRYDGNGRSSDTSNYEIHVYNGVVTEFHKLPPNIGLGVNPFDCTLVEIYGEEGSMASPKDGHPTIISRARNTLFSARDAQSVRFGSDFGYSVIEYENEGGSQRIELAPPSGSAFRGDRSLRVSRASNSPNYLLYEAGTDLSGRPDKWPMDAWTVDLAKNVATQLELPAGPWVNEYDEKLRCFSCGCGCYRKLDLYLVEPTIYGHVSGIGYPARVEGIYALDLLAPDKTWTEVVGGVFARSLAFAPSGCKLAYADPKLKILDLC